MGYYLVVKRYTPGQGMQFLLFASLAFYCWWKPEYTILLVASILANFCLGLLVENARNQLTRRFFMTLGIFFNLALLGYFKYGFFVVDNINQLVDTNYSISKFILPLGISFFTFQQISYLVDVYNKKVVEKSLVKYALFVSFFPQLIAGPIVHHSEMLPQFLRARPRPVPYLLIIGLTFFSIGLFKKTILADGFSGYGDTLFTLVDSGLVPTFLEAWVVALSYTVQLYFDFSGYSDMAIGIAFMFGIRLPLNFNSPYKSTSIIDFWRSWHMTLSRFLKEYLYFPLGGNRGGPSRTYINLIIVMLLGGLWHGASWTFVAWGGLHGLYLLVNHAWRHIRGARGGLQDSSVSGLSTVFMSFVYKVFSIALTFVAVVVAWVYFRATTFETANAIVSGMFGLNGILLPDSLLSVVPQKLAASGLFLDPASYRPLADFGALYPALQDVMFLLGKMDDFSRTGPVSALVTLMLPLAIVFLLPNTHQFMGKFSPVLVNAKNASEPVFAKDSWLTTFFLRWRPNIFWTIVVAFIFAYGCFGNSGVQKFLYFNF